MRERPSRLVGLLLVTASWLVATSAAGQEIRAEVDRNQVAMGGQVVLQIHIDGSRDARPRLPPLDDFNVYPAGTESRFQMINGNASVGVTYKYVLQPKSLGRKQVGPASVDVDGQTLTSEPFTINVVDATADSESSRDYFLTVNVSETEPYVGQQVLYTWRFFRRGRVADARLTTLEFGDLVSEDLGDVREYETTVDGVRYLVSEIRKALFPQRPGPVTIPPSELQCQVETRERRRRRSFFDFGTVPMEARVLRSRPLEITVRPLPAEPAGFLGLVGEFDIRASISKRELNVNESATLSVTLSGVGNVQLLNAPALPELADFKIYDDKPSGSIDRSGRVLQGSKTFRKALVPLEAGERVIPSLELVYFDTDSGSYQTKRTAPITLDVSPARGEESLNLTESVAPTTGKVAVRVLADDILPIQRGLDAMRPPLAARLGLVWGGLAGALPLGLFALALVFSRRQERFAKDSGLRRRQNALRQAQSELKALGTQGEARYDTELVASRCSAVLRGYVGDKLDLEGTALTTTEVERALAERAVDEATVRRVREMLERFEAAQYAAGSQAPGTGPSGEQTIRSVEGIIGDLDRMLGGRR